MSDAHRAYGAVAIGLHWLVFAFITANWLLGPYMVDLPLSPQKLKYFSWHKWIGVTVFLLAVFRVAWRLSHPPPPLPASVAPWQCRAARLSHLLLYLLIFAIPITGWMYSSASGVPTVYLGWVQLPDLVGRDKALAEQLKQAHISLNMVLLAVVFLHVAAALKHHFVDRDDVLARMLPFLGKSSDRG
jgi:cytochrome b561